MRLKLVPMDDSLDMVLVKDGHGTTIGMLPLDGFLEGPTPWQIYDKLWKGEAVDVDVAIATEDESRGS